MLDTFANLVDKMDNDFVLFCDYLGTFAFAISGIRLAASKGFDWFGALVVGFVTAVGGGTLRDLFLDEPLFWLETPSYISISFFALLFTIAMRKQVVRANYSLFFFDSVGLGLFVVVGIVKSFEAGYPWWVALVMAVVTGSFGGMTRDILINEVPLIFRQDIYALACLFGGGIYVLLAYYTTMPLPLIQFISAISVFGMRTASILLDLGLPTFKAISEEELNDSTPLKDKILAIFKREDIPTEEASSVPNDTDEKDAMDKYNSIINQQKQELIEVLKKDKEGE